ncbi:hypothetical protein BCR43DRAFT_32305 [Syncephalastrum racemosum]|uniref:Uncharacterized protein n=1 Tax=Syncephalastrum racemosum TaxID=13706 RepID=A0A1X2HTW6_SYNRA|nr:hypothetical protein BCR43DRAFT_32305 [Syncephalastrum racemosum]
MMMPSRLEQFKTQHELARNFYDDDDFCPIRSCEEEIIEHRQRIQQRISPQSSPRTSPPSAPRRAIPIIDPANMTPVAVPSKAPWPLPSRVIPIVDPSTGQVFQYDVSVR